MNAAVATKVITPDWQTVLRELNSQIAKIDQEGKYPAEIIKAVGAHGGFRLSPSNQTTSLQLGVVHKYQVEIAKICVNTAFLCWCQSACGWYLLNTTNNYLKEKFLQQVANGEILAGTGLSNPIKSLAGIEEIKVTAQKVKGGYLLTGSLPWVSNVKRNHYFGVVFTLSSKANGVSDIKNPYHDNELRVGFIDTNNTGIRMKNTNRFVALNGSTTVAVVFDNYFLPDDFLLAEDGLGFLKKIRPGFILLQTAMGLGITGSVLRELDLVLEKKIHLNELYQKQVLQYKQIYELQSQESLDLLLNPYVEDDFSFKKILSLRLRIAEHGLKVSQLNLILNGSNGYLKNSTAFRKFREAHFISIVTPSVTQLTRMLSDN